MAISDDVRKVMMAGLGALSVLAEKTQETVETLAKKGEEALDHGQVFNERLRHKVKQAIHNTEPGKDEILNALDRMTPEELEEIKVKLQNRKPDEQK